MIEANSSTAGTEGLTGTILWHPDLHREIAHEQLTYMMVGFRPQYSREHALQIIDKATELTSVRSYVVWELHRKPDILLKVWLPPGKNADDLWEALRDVARQQPRIPLDLAGTTFQVGRTISHYLWPRRLEPSDIEDAVSKGGDHLMDGSLVESVPKQLIPLFDRSVAVLAPSETSGIKFFIWISVAELAPSERARAALETQLVEISHTCAHVYGASLYAGSSGSDYLLSGRIKQPHYETLARDLQLRLSNLGGQFLALNTDTSLSTLFTPVDRVEALVPARSLTPPIAINGGQLIELSDVLELEESDRLEFKGTAFDLLLTEQRDISQAERANRVKKARDAVIKACTGFLNADGGLLVIGVVEASRFSLDDAKGYSASAVQVGDYIVIGTETTIDGKGTVSWDEYERRLRALIAGAITPSPDPWFAVHKLSYGDLTVAAVSVSEPDTWFWATTSTEHDVFYVRYGNATRPLRGTSQLQHIRSKPYRQS